MFHCLLYYIVSSNYLILLSLMVRCTSNLYTADLKLGLTFLMQNGRLQTSCFALNSNEILNSILVKFGSYMLITKIQLVRNHNIEKSVPFWPQGFFFFSIRRLLNIDETPTFRVLAIARVIRASPIIIYKNPSQLYMDHRWLNS